VLDVPMWLWTVFVAGVAVMLTIDLFAHRRAHVIGFREAAWWSAAWVGVSVLFAGLVWASLGTEPAVEFTTAWLLEKSLSVDNLFVFALIFGYFAVPKQYQHRALFYGVIGALVLRAVFIGAGVAVVNTFTAVLFVFAAILLWSAYKLVKDDGTDFDPSTNLAVRLVRKLMPVQDEYAGARFVVKRAGRWVATPMLVVVVAIEAADLLFAVDSVPAVLAVSSEPFIVYSSNAFAILGLRALYFLLAGMMDRFHYLSKALAVILGFIGVKLTLHAAHETISTSVPEIPSLVSLIVIVVLLAGAVLLSLARPRPPVAPRAVDSEPGEHTAQERYDADPPAEAGARMRHASVTSSASRSTSTSDSRNKTRGIRS
jgi:tellurite resistance protein TerC